MLRPSQGSILTSSRAAQRRTARRERARAAGSLARGLAMLGGGLGGFVLDTVLLLGLPIAYACASFLVLALPLRVLFGDAHLTLVGTLTWLMALLVSGAGLVRAVAGSEPVAPVRPGFARAMVVLNWLCAIVLAITDLSR